MIYQQSVFEPWPIESESVQAVITSPPYFSLRKYAIPDVIIGGDKDCKHEFGLTKDKLLNLQAGNPEFKREWRKEATQTINNGSFCIHCNAWQGQYGLEPTPQIYVEHTLLWAKEAWRVLRDDGIFFLNLADSYSGGGRGYGGKSEYLKGKGAQNPKLENYPLKCQLLIPHRVAIALVDAGWTLRNILYGIKQMPCQKAQPIDSRRSMSIFSCLQNKRNIILIWIQYVKNVPRLTVGVVINLSQRDSRNGIKALDRLHIEIETCSLTMA